MVQHPQHRPDRGTNTGNAAPAAGLTGAGEPGACARYIKVVPYGIEIPPIGKGTYNIWRYEATTQPAG